MEQLKVDERKKMPGVYIGDPCYILPDDFYQKFWGETHSYEDGAFTTEEGRPVMIVAATAYGDGRYPGEILNHATGERTEYDFGVDAGCLSIVNLEFSDPKKIEEVRESSSLGIIIDQPCIGMQLNEDGGAFDIDVLIPAGPGERTSSHYVHIETAGYDDDEPIEKPKREPKFKADDKVYIRFGEIPEDERSVIYFHQQPAGGEDGVSVYEAAKNMHGDWVPLLPTPITENGLTDFMYYIQYYRGKAYLVSGEMVGRGSDNEPLLKEVNIISDFHLNYNK